MNMHLKRNEGIQRLTTPRSAALAGILFAVLFATSMVLIRMNLPETISGDENWMETGRAPIKFALLLMPFAGISFLWFVGVIRDLLGEHEDQFFATVFFGSSLLFLAMVFVSSAIAGAILASAYARTGVGLHQDVVLISQAIMRQISNVYALRMASIFMMSLATIWLRTRILPRWLTAFTFVLALLLMLTTSLSLWVALVFPFWVMVISVAILYMQHRSPQFLVD